MWTLCLRNSNLRKASLGVFLLIFSATQAYAQLRISLRLDPTISYNRVELVSDSISAFNAKSSFLSSLGVVFEFTPHDRYHFLLSVNYQPRHVRYNYNRRLPGRDQPVKESEFQKLQYLTLGTGLKLLTDDIFTNGRMYFTLEPTFAFKIHQNLEGESAKLLEERIVEQARFIDVMLRLVAGAEYDIGLQTALFAGIFYERGFVNMVAEGKNLTRDTKFLLRNDRIGLSLGIKF